MKDVSIPLNKVILKLQLWSFAVIVLLSFIYIAIYDDKLFFREVRHIYSVYSIVFFLIGLFLHELIHLSLYYYDKAVSFGDVKIKISLKTFSFITTCNTPINLLHYRIIILMPGVLLGLLPYILILIFNYTPLLLWSIIFTGVSVGDFYVFWILRHLKNKEKVLDHEKNIGCYIL